MTPLGTIVVSALFVSIVLTVVAIVSRSWLEMWVAALLSLVFSIVAGFSLGPFVFLLTSLQLMSAIGMRWRASGLTWTSLLALGIIIWVALVPLQLISGVVLLPWLIGFPLVTLICTIILFARGGLKSKAT
jgi:hypothetical protein